MTAPTITRAEAKAQGLKRFFTGLPCKHGHLAERIVSNTKCVECCSQSNLVQRQRKPADPVRRAADAKEWRKKNPDRRKETYTNWCRNNPERLRKIRRRSDAKNIGTKRANTARWRAAVRQATPPWLTEEHKRQIAYIYAARPDGFHVDHIFPLNGENSCGLHVPWNLQHLPGRVNSAKRNTLPLT